jgi:hypothetical protein
MDDEYKNCPVSDNLSGNEKGPTVCGVTDRDVGLVNIIPAAGF